MSRAEGPRIVSLRLNVVDRIATALDIRIDILARWRGGELDRLLNAGHAAMQEQVLGLLARFTGWVSQAEVSFSIYGERGVLDILAFHPASGSLLVIELKTSVVDVGGLMAQVDRYMRLASRVAMERGWQPRTVSCWVVVSDNSTNRRRAVSGKVALRNAFPADGRHIHTWLRDPNGSVRAFSYLVPERPGANPSARRVRAPRPSGAR